MYLAKLTSYTKNHNFAIKFRYLKIPIFLTYVMQKKKKVQSSNI